MQDKLTKLESQQTEQLSRVSKDDFNVWLATSSTKALFTQIELDLEELKQNWADDKYNTEEEIKARGQAAYLTSLKDVIMYMHSDD